MAVEMEARPIQLRNAVVEIDGQKLSCLARRAGFNRDETTADDYVTFCGSYPGEGTVTWSLVLTLGQSFDPGGTHEILKAAAVKGDVPFRIIPSDRRPVGPDNPAFSGVARVTYNPWPATEVGNRIELEIEWPLIGDWVEETEPAA